VFSGGRRRAAPCSLLNQTLRSRPAGSIFPQAEVQGASLHSMQRDISEREMIASVLIMMLFLLVNDRMIVLLSDAAE
jgi:hypothetical protein